MSDDHACCASHCCLIHGCKYGLSDCPVATGKVVQDGPCYECGERAEEVREIEESPAPHICPKCRQSDLVFTSAPAKLPGPPWVGPLRVKCLTCKHEGPVADFMRRQPEARPRPTAEPSAGGLDMGHMVEGTISQTSDGRLVIDAYEGDLPVQWDVLEALKKYEGKEVRFILVTLDTVNRIAEMVQQGGFRIEDAVVGGRR